MIINQPHLCTKLEVWAPRYNDKYEDEYGEPVALLHKDKIDYGSPTIIVEFTKAKHLKGQRFAIRKTYAQSHSAGTNGNAPMYEIPMSHLENWASKQEILNTVDSLW